MVLSRFAQEFADEIKQHDWSDAHTRLDRAGHNHDEDGTNAAQLPPEQADHVRTNVMWVVAQVLKYNDPNLDVHEFAEACNVPDRIRLRKDGTRSGAIPAGLRIGPATGTVGKPGTSKFPL